MLEVKVVVTLAPEVLSLLGGLVGNKTAVHTDKEEVKEVLKAEEEPKQEEPKEEVKEAPKTEEQTKEQSKPSLTYLQLRERATPVIDNRRSEVKKILEEFKVNKLSDLDQKHYQAFYDKIGELI